MSLAGICFQAYIPMRKEPDEKSEMINQVLYGETFIILESYKKTNFTYIHLEHDSYEGWIDSKTIYILSASDREVLFSVPRYISHEIKTVLKSGNNSFNLIIGCGSTVYLKGLKVLDLTGNDYNFKGDVNESNPEDPRTSLVKYGLRLLSVPYLWGGRSSFGIDCSGLCQNLYKQVGMNIPRDAVQQSKIGKPISFLDEVQAGDLAFFDNENGEIIHVGMIIDKNRIIHSSGMVKIEVIDHQGIFCSQQNRYSHKLRVIKNILD